MRERRGPRALGPLRRRVDVGRPVHAVLQVTLVLEDADQRGGSPHSATQVRRHLHRIKVDTIVGMPTSARTAE